MSDALALHAPTGPGGQWGPYPAVPVTVRPLRSRGEPCPLGLCQSRFPNRWGTWAHVKTQHFLAYQGIVTDVLQRARAGRTDAEIAQELGLTERRVVDIRTHNGLVRSRAWYAHERTGPEFDALVEADEHLLIEVLRRREGLTRTRDLFRLFNLERQRVVRPRLAYTRTYSLVRRLAKQGRIVGTKVPVRGPRGWGLTMVWRLTT